MLKELSSEASKKRLPLVRRSVELRHSPAMSHRINPATIINNGEVMFKTCILCKKTIKSFKGLALLLC